MRNSELSRETKETSVRICLDLDGSGDVSIDTGIPFLDHMLCAFGKHGRMDLVVKARGDLEIDCHHLVEDIGIVLGEVLKKSRGEGRGMRRFAFSAIPMDESMAQVAMDWGGRGYLVMNGEFSEVPVGGIPGDLFEHFFYSLCIRAGITAHCTFYGRNDHHKCEALFKSFGIALHEASRIDPTRTDIPSTKGTMQ
jgi:imidazoleglycerol-phosphate dehydratase